MDTPFLNAKTSIRFEKRCAIKILRDNPLLARLIEVGTKALGRELMSGETLRAPRQQLRRLRASAFDFESPKNYSFSEPFARLSGARLHFWRVRR